MQHNFWIICSAFYVVLHQNSKILLEQVKLVIAALLFYTKNNEFSFSKSGET